MKFFKLGREMQHEIRKNTLCNQNVTKLDMAIFYEINQLISWFKSKFGTFRKVNIKYTVNE